MYTLDPSKVYKEMCQNLTPGKSTYDFCLFVWTTQVFNFLNTSKFLLQNLPAPIRGVIHRGLWIPWSDVMKNAAQTRPNPRYRGIGPQSEIFNVLAIDGGMYRSLEVRCIVKDYISGGR